MLQCSTETEVGAVSKVKAFVDEGVIEVIDDMAFVEDGMVDVNGTGGGRAAK
jgi:hypothetical protein